jgi:hypothetical protein
VLHGNEALDLELFTALVEMIGCLDGVPHFIRTINRGALGSAVLLTPPVYNGVQQGFSGNA